MTHSIYRKGTDFNKVINSAVTFISNGGYAIWDMLVFKHNHHQVETCKTLSQSLGFKEFCSKNTNRFIYEDFPVLDKKGKIIYKLYPTHRSLELKTEIKKQNLTNSSVKISCKSKKEKVYMLVQTV